MTARLGGRWSTTLSAISLRGAVVPVNSGLLHQVRGRLLKREQLLGVVGLETQTRFLSLEAISLVAEVRFVGRRPTLWTPREPSPVLSPPRVEVPRVQALPTQKEAELAELRTAVGDLDDAQLFVVGEGAAGGPVGVPRRFAGIGRDGVLGRIGHDERFCRSDMERAIWMI